MEVGETLGGNIDKTEINDRHFRRKMKERLGWDITDQLKKQIIASLSERNLVEKISKTRMLYSVYIRGLYLMVVYDKKRKSIITAWRSNKNYEIQF